MEYIEFEVEITAGRGRTYNLAVLRSPAGEPRSTFKLPFDQRGLQLHLLSLENALLRSGATHTRRIASPDEAPVRSLGEALFGSLLNSDVLSCYDQSQREAREQGKGLRLKLRIQAPELAALPWEFLYDPREDEFVCLSRRTPIVRYLEPRQSVPPLSLRPPLRILGLVASPEGLAKLDIPTEQRRVEEALKDLLAAQAVELVWLPGQTWTDLQNAMWQGPWHIFHFIGHGGFDADRDEGVLALADEGGGKRLLTATELGRLLSDHYQLRLAVLNACEGARGGGLDIFSSTAATLVRRGVPAVVAMQYEVSDGAAIQFGNRFYAAIAHGMAADAALAEARIGMSVATRESAEWGTPVLYTNTADLRLFDLADIPAVRPAPRSHVIQPAVGPADQRLVVESQPARPKGSVGRVPIRFFALAWALGCVVGWAVGAAVTVNLPGWMEGLSSPLWLLNAAYWIWILPGPLRVVSLAGVGLIGGLISGLARRHVHESFTIKHVLLLAAGWCMAGAIGSLIYNWSLTTSNKNFDAAFGLALFPAVGGGVASFIEQRSTGSVIVSSELWSAAGWVLAAGVAVLPLFVLHYLGVLYDDSDPIGVSVMLVVSGSTFGAIGGWTSQRARGSA